MSRFPFCMDSKYCKNKCVTKLHSFNKSKLTRSWPNGNSILCELSVVNQKPSCVVELCPEGKHGFKALRHFRGMRTSTESRISSNKASPNRSKSFAEVQSISKASKSFQQWEEVSRPIVSHYGRDAHRHTVASIPFVYRGRLRESHSIHVQHARSQCQFTCSSTMQTRNTIVCWNQRWERKQRSTTQQP